MAGCQFALFSILASVVTVSIATHFRGITTNFIPLDTQGRVRICHKIAWKLGTSEGKCTADKIDDITDLVGEARKFACDEIPSSSSGCEANEIGTLQYVCRGFFGIKGADNSWSLGDNCFETTFDLQQTRRFYIKDTVPCCWISLVDVVTFDIEARMMIDLRVRSDLVALSKPIPINTSPETTLQPVTRTQLNCPFRLKISANDEDGDTVRCRFAIGAENCGGVCGTLENQGATIDSDSCVLSWNPTKAGLHAAAVVIEDFDSSDVLLSSVPLQFLIEVFDLPGDCRTPTVSPLGGVCFRILASASFSLDISAVQAVDLAGNEIDRIVITSKPDAMTVGSLARVGSSTTWRLTVSWTPTPAEYRSHLLCYFAADVNGLESPLQCVTLKAGVTDSLPTIQTVAPKDPGRLVDPPVLTIEFTGPVSVSTQSKSITMFEFDTDAEFEVIDTTSSQITLFDGNLKANITLAKGDDIFPDRRYYVLVESGAFAAFEDCAGVSSPVDGISNKNDWHFIADGPDDVNECAHDTLNNCHEYANCTNQNPGFLCVCLPGFTGNGVDCADIDECILDLDNCNVNAECTNTKGSFMCTCNVGWIGNGIDCDDDDECADPNRCAMNADCANNPGSFSCTCNTGYSGNGRIECSNIDECARGIDDECVDNTFCTDTDGSYDCTCSSGYSGNGRMQCNDIDECVLGLDNCNDICTSCTNTVGSFECTYVPGFTGDGTTCIDIDECVPPPPPCDPNAVCTNTFGSFNCMCRQGFSGDGSTCVDVGNCTDEWPVVRDRYLAVDDDWRNLTNNCPAANLTDPPAMSTEPPIEQWRKIVHQFVKDYEEWLKIVRNLVSGVPPLPPIDPNATPEEVWDAIRPVHEAAQKAWQEQVGDPNDIQFPDPTADCEDERRRLYVISKGTTEQAMDKYRDVFGEVCDAV